MSSFWELVAKHADDAVVGFTVLAALSGLALAVASRHVKKIEAARLEEKERRQAADSKDKDLKIAVANQRAAEANERTEKERFARIAFEISQRPRHIGRPGGNLLEERLGKYASIPLQIDFLEGDKEARTIARDLASSLVRAGWPHDLPISSTTEFRARDGIEILPTEIMGPSREAGEAIEEFIAANLVEARVTIWSPIMGTPPSPSTLRIIVGPDRRGLYAHDRFVEESSMSDFMRENVEADRLKQAQRMLRLQREWYPSYESQKPPGTVRPKVPWREEPPRPKP